MTKFMIKNHLVQILAVLCLIVSFNTAAIAGETLPPNPYASAGGGFDSFNGVNPDSDVAPPYNAPGAIPDHQTSSIYTPSMPGVPNLMNVPGYYNPNVNSANSPFMPIVNNQLPSILGNPKSAFASYGQLAPIPAGVPTNKIRGNRLPDTTLDSFVKNAGGEAEFIYGDEGTDQQPKMNGLTRANTISHGFHGIDNLGLTTGHGSYLPDASGVGYSFSGPRHPHQKKAKELPRHTQE